MTRDAYPYSHEDISVLARSLKQQLAELGRPPKHVELLNALARAAGQQNYQSWLAQRKVTSPQPATASTTNIRLPTSGSVQPLSEPLLVRVSKDAYAREVFEQDSTGRYLDRRHEPVTRILALIDVELAIAGKPKGVLRVRGSVKADLLPAGADPQQWFKPYVPAALTEVLTHAPERVSVFGTLDLPLDGVVAKGSVPDFVGHTLETSISIASGHCARLARECEQADLCSRSFEYVKELLWEIFGIESPTAAVRAHGEQLLQIARYLREYLAAEGDMFMGAWNNEKLGGAARLLERAVRNSRSVPRNDWKWARRSVFSADPPAHWNHVALPPPQLLASASADPSDDLQNIA